MYRARLLLFVAATALIAACSSSTSPTDRRFAPKALHDGDSTRDTTSHGWVNPNG
jgi:hypothetical protein